MPNKRKRRQNKSYKAQYEKYKSNNTQKKNKEKKVLRHLTDHPNDKQAEDSL